LTVRISTDPICVNDKENYFYATNMELNKGKCRDETGMALLQLSAELHKAIYLINTPA